MLLAAVTACLMAGQDGAVGGDARPNVVLISMDTLRADHLGCYGHECATSPNIDRLAAESLVFDDVVCEVPLTGPSLAAMLSSQYPRVTGATRNALPLPDEVPTVVESYAAAGYHTICVQSNWTLKRDLSNLQRGFAVYDDDFHKKRWGFVKAERDADEVTRLALEYLEAWDGSAPLFAWFHYSDPHAPYKLHRKFDVGRSHRGSREGDVKRRYDSEIAFADDQIGRVLDALPEENTYVVFLSDHGESLYEHDYLGHGRRIYQNSMQIAFMIKGPGIDAGRISTLGCGIDVGPTLLSLAGLNRIPGMMGVDLLTAEVPDTRPRVVETYGGAVIRLPGVKSIMANARPQLQGVIVEGWKLILEGDRSELYYLPDDPGELKDLSPGMPWKVEELSAIIARWDASTAQKNGEGAALTEDDLEALESLGYIE